MVSAQRLLEVAVPGHDVLHRLHLLARLRSDGDWVCAGSGLQRPERASLVRISIVADRYGGHDGATGNPGAGAAFSFRRAGGQAGNVIIADDARRHDPHLSAMWLGLNRHPARRAAFAAGAHAVLPSLPAIAVWGLVTGVAMMKLGMTLGPALGMTFIVYSGTSQLTVLPLMAGSTAVLTMVLAAALASLRFVVYSAVLSRHLSRLPLPLRLGTAFLTIDPAVAMLTQRQRAGRLVQRVALLNGANVIIAVAWCSSSLLGIALAAVLPMGAELAYLGLLALFAITVPMLVDRPAWAAAAVSVAVTLLGSDWPHRLGAFAAVLAGVAAALLAAPRRHKD